MVMVMDMVHGHAHGHGHGHISHEFATCSIPSIQLQSSNPEQGFFVTVYAYLYPKDSFPSRIGLNL